jgi:GNAT superfamily N-acetyltransferase
MTATEDTRSDDGAVVVATTPEQVQICFPVMAQLRPAFSREEFTARVARLNAEEGYRLVYVQINGKAGAVAGFRTGQSLAWGRYLYVDDLVTDSGMRSLGLGQQLIEWLFEEASRLGCEAMHLDSGVHRFDAHRFYMRNGLEIRSHHFSRLVG